MGTSPASNMTGHRTIRTLPTKGYCDGVPDATVSSGAIRDTQVVGVRGKFNVKACLSYDFQQFQHKLHQFQGGTRMNNIHLPSEEP